MIVVMSDALRSSLPSLHDDFPCHLRMQAAEIIVAAGIGECEGKRVVSLQRLRPEGLVLVDDIVRNVVMIDPLDRRPCGNSQSGGPKVKLSIVTSGDFSDQPNAKIESATAGRGAQWYTAST